MVAKILGCLAVAALGATMSFCSKDAVVYSRFYTFPDSRWMRDEYLDFNMKDADSTLLQAARGLPCTGILTIRHTEDFPYRNLWLTVENRQKNGLSTIDTVKCSLGSDNLNWEGRGARGVYEWRDTIFSREHLSQDRRIIVSRLMTDSALPGIMNAGLTIVLTHPQDSHTATPEDSETANNK